MTKTKLEIAQDLLKEAGYYWYENNEDAVEKLDPESFDPVIDKLFKANAVEIEKLYMEIEESERRVISGLSKSLVPDSSLLPLPGIAIAQLKTKFNRLEISPKDRFTIVGADAKGETKEFYFTSLFDHNFPGCEAKYLVTNSMVLDISDTKISEIKQNSNAPNYSQTRYAWLGLELKGLFEENDELIFTIGNNLANNFNPDYYAFCNATCTVNGEFSVEYGKGFDHKKNTADKSLLHALNIPDSHERQVLTRIQESFLSIREFPNNLEELKSFSPLEESTQLEVPGSIPLLWIKFEFNLPVSNDYFRNNRINVNTVPLVNRRLLEDHVVKQNYDRILFPMPVENYFLSVNRIWDEHTADEELGYKKIDFLNPESTPGSYIVRSSSSIRRFNSQDANQQIHRLLGVIEDEYQAFKEGGVNRLREDFTVIEQALNRIKKEVNDEFYTKARKTPYIGVAHFQPGTLHINYEYWETQADILNALKDEMELPVTSSIPGTTGLTVTPIQKGRGELTEKDYINLLKEAILSRNKIVTKGDIEQYCLGRYGHLIELLSIDRKLVSFGGEFKRVILITLELKEGTENADNKKAMITNQLQNELNALSSFFIPIEVTFDTAGNGK